VGLCESCGSHGPMWHIDTCGALETLGPHVSHVGSCEPCGSAAQALVYIKLRAEFANDKAANGLEMVIPFPKEVQRVSCDIDKEAKPAGVQTWDWQEKARRLVWKFKKVQGGSEHTLRVRFPAHSLPPLSEE
jgi:hypothetical protein